MVTPAPQGAGSATKFPHTDYDELKNRVYRPRWNIPVRREAEGEKSLAECIVAATTMIREGGELERGPGWSML